MGGMHGGPQYNVECHCCMYIVYLWHFNRDWYKLIHQRSVANCTVACSINWCKIVCSQFCNVYHGSKLPHILGWNHDAAADKKAIFLLWSRDCHPFLDTWTHWICNIPRDFLPEKDSWNSRALLKAAQKWTWHVWSIK